MALRVRLILYLLLLTPEVGFSSALSLDQTFRPPPFSARDYSFRAMSLPDGKYLLFRAPDTLRDQPGSSLMRYLPDGSVDSSFNFSGYDFVYAVAPLGTKLVVAASQVVYGHPSEQNHILLVNDDGSVDPTFDAAAVANGQVWTFSVQPDGKILVGGLFTAFDGAPRQGLVRLLGNGTVDPGFAAVTLQVPTRTNSYGVRALRLQADGKVLIGGDFDAVNNVACPRVARLNCDGTLDSTFHASGFTPTSSIVPVSVQGIVLQSDGKILVGGKFTVSSSFASNHTGAQYTKLPIIRLNTDGTADQSYGCFSPVNFGSIKDLVIDSDDKAVGVSNSAFRFNTDGSIDSTFHPPVLIDDSVRQSPGAYTVNITSNGGLLLAGVFGNVENAGDASPIGHHFAVARLNGDGTVNQTFNTSHETSDKAVPQSFLILNDGSTLVAFGQTGFLTSEATIPHNFARLTWTGSLDAAFDPVATFDPNGSLGPDFVITTSTVLPNGDFFVGGNVPDFTSSYGIIRRDGTQMLRYALSSSDYRVSYAVPYEGGVLIGYPEGLQFDGAISGYNGWRELRRLTPTGDEDADFDLSQDIRYDHIDHIDLGTNWPDRITIASNVLAILQDGKILYTYFGKGNKYHLVRLNSDGSKDSGFAEEIVQIQSPVVSPGFSTDILSTAPVFTDALELPSGKIMVVGEFTSYAGYPAHGIVRLNSDGTVDTTFQPGAAAQWVQTTEGPDFHPAIDNIEMSTDGKFLITGTFEAYSRISYPGIASLNQNGTPDTTFVAPARRQKFDPRRTYLKRQPDGSYFLSGPYTFPGDSLSPSFVHIKNTTKFLVNAFGHTNSSTMIGFDGVAGVGYRLEYKDQSSNTDWQAVPGVPDFVAAATGPSQFIDPMTGLQQRFYRIRLVP